MKYCEKCEEHKRMCKLITRLEKALENGEVLIIDKRRLNVFEMTLLLSKMKDKIK